MFAFSGIAAIGQINEALHEGDSLKTLAMLQNPAAKLTDVDPSVAQHYHDKLLEACREKAHVRHMHTHAHTRALQSEWKIRCWVPRAALTVFLLLFCLSHVQVSIM